MKKCIKGLVDMRNDIEYTNVNENNAKNLAEVFREIKEIRKNKVYFDEADEYFNKRVYTKSKKNKKIKKMIAIDLVIMISISFGVFANYIFAFTNESDEINNVEAIAAVKFEANSSALEMEEILIENISILKTKKLIEENREIEFETKYVDDENLPLGEEVIYQEGVLGSKDVTVINTFENDELVDEKLIEEVILQEPVEKVINIGTSTFLKDKEIHIGDTVFVTTDVILKEKNNINSNDVCEIPSSIEAKLESISGDWCKVLYNNKEGYILSNNLTSSNANPEILEANRIQKIKLAVSEDMPLNKSSGLKLKDFVKILSNNSQDKNNIFKDSAEDFYNADINYNVNGVFLASIGIHESAWGTSTIAMNKRNLFGFGAYDNSPYESAITFDSYYNGIEILAKTLTKNYLNLPGTVLANGETATGIYYNGNTVAGVNIKYASDTEWHNKVYKYMTKLYNNL